MSFSAFRAWDIQCGRQLAADLRGPMRPRNESPFCKSCLVIGRDIGSDIVLEGNTVSRKHAEMFLDPFGRWWVRDLGSRNGIYAGDRKVNEWALRPGDVVQVGDYFLTYESGQPSAASNATLSTLHTSEDTGQLLSLEEIRPPNIDAAHLSLLIEFGRQLLNVEADTDRAERMCNLMLRPEFGPGSTRLILRSVDGGDVEVLSGPYHADGSKANPYISRRLIDSVRTTGRPGARPAARRPGPMW